VSKGEVNLTADEAEIITMRLPGELAIGSLLPVMTGCLVLNLLVTGQADAQSSYSGRIIDLRSPLSQDIMALVNQSLPSLPLNDIEIITRDVQLAALDYSFQPGLLLALMAAEEMYPGFPQARLYYYNLDMGSLADESLFPSAWYDAQRVARAYAAEYERYEDRTAAVAAYFVGSRALPADGDISGLSAGLRDLVGEVLRLDAQNSHLGERGGPQVVQPDEDTPETGFEAPEYDYSEIERAYIQNMMYFNSRLDEDTAKEIFEAIRQHASDYATVDARLVMALVACESSFRPDAVSRAGAQGLGQLMPFTAERFGVSDPFDVNENIRATFAYLAREIERWASHNYPLDRVLAAYNAGPNAVERYTDPPHNGIPPYQETVNYVRRVVNIYFYLLPEEERAEMLRGQSRHITEENGIIQLAQ